MGKNKLTKFKEMAEFPNVIQPLIKDFPKDDFFLKGKWSKDFFQNNNNIVLELGCGKAEFTVALAEKNKNINYIAIDIKGARMWTGAKKAIEKNLKNAAFLRIKIDFLPFFFAQNEVSEIWLPFPDPQPKKVKKRLTSPKFLNLYRKILKNNAIIHLKTDNYDLFRYTLKVLEKNNVKPLIAVDDLYASEIDGIVSQVKTYYEKQFLEQGKKITYIKFRFSKNIVWENIPVNYGSHYK